MAPIRHQAIIGIKDGKFTDTYMRHLALCVKPEVQCKFISAIRLLHRAKAKSYHKDLGSISPAKASANHMILLTLTAHDPYEVHTLPGAP